MEEREVVPVLGLGLELMVKAITLTLTLALALTLEFDCSVVLEAAGDEGLAALGQSNDEEHVPRVRVTIGLGLG